MRKQAFCIYAKKAQISAYVFATQIVQFLFFLNPSFPASRQLLCLYSLVYVGPVRKQHCRFCHDAAQLSDGSEK